MNSSPCPCNIDKEQVRQLALAAGAYRVGFAAVDLVDDSAVNVYNERLAEGCFGEMEYLKRNNDIRRNPRMLLEGAQTIICCAFSYHQATPHPYIADYALGDDYHDVLRRRLSDFCDKLKALYGGATRICIDSAPLRERYWAVNAGLGVIGLNGQLITPGAGSQFFLAEVLWTCATEPDAPLAPTTCSQCGACVKACPGKALKGNGGLDARRCLSYLTIEYRGEFADDMPAMQGYYGCDICQRVCPMNRVANPPSCLPEFEPRESLAQLTPDRVVEMTQDEFSRTFKGSAIKRTKLVGLVRNARRLLLE
jgi:epoxyqueuosine reductase